MENEREHPINPRGGNRGRGRWRNRNPHSAGQYMPNLMEVNVGQQSHGGYHNDGGRRHYHPYNHRRGQSVQSDHYEGHPDYRGRRWRGSENHRGGQSHRGSSPHGSDDGGNQNQRDEPDLETNRKHNLITILMEKSKEEVLETLANERSAWPEIFDPSKFSPNDVFNVVRILGEKICIEEEEEGKNGPLIIEIILCTMDPTFSRKVHKVCEIESKDIDEKKRFLRCLYTFLSSAIDRLPTRSADFVKPIIPAAIQLTNLILNKLEENDEETTLLKSDFEELQDWIKGVTGEGLANPIVISNQDKPVAEPKKKERRNPFQFTAEEERILHSAEPPDDFRSISIVPSIEEILSPEESFLRPNKLTGAYNNADHYVDVQFRLFREDFLRPLKQGIQEFMKNKREYISGRKRMPFGTVRLYQKIRITNVELVRDNVTYTLKLQDNLAQHVKWDKSRRLLNGSLLLLTPDNFQSAYFGTVSRRDADELKKGTFGIVWEGDKPEFSRKDQEFIMFESECYFEAYRHTLQVLKDIPLEIFPMAKYIVQSSSEVQPPQYLIECYDLMKIGQSYINPIHGEWPSAQDLELDPSQFQAFRAALTKEFAIIQGPPGTGKTFLGLKVVEALLSNIYLWRNSDNGGGPILIVCLTNHALDQFLLGILSILRKFEPEQEPGLIRVGGRSKSSELEEFSLGRKRVAASKLHSHDKYYTREKNNAWRRVKALESERADFMCDYIGLKNPIGILDFSRLSVGLFRLLDGFEDPRKVLDNYLHNPRWYGLHSDNFYNPNFNANTYIRNTFKVLPPTPREKEKPQKHKMRLEDDEDYDLDELQENRISMDELFYQAEFKAGKDAKNHSKDLEYKLSITTLEKDIQNNRDNIRECRQQNYDGVNDRLRRLQETEILLANQRSFMEAFFKLVAEGRVELPEDFDGFDYASPSQAWGFYYRMVDQARELVATRLTQKEAELVAAQKELQLIQRRGDGILLQKTKVVGMTTTGASKAADLLQTMKSKIVIVEEAAEVLEAHIINCITEHCEHLIMIGDHQQLRPNITVMELSTKYHLNVSLFERMVNNKLNCYRLLVQHRMRPEISDLVRGTIYSELEDHPSVLDFPSIKGMAKNLFFVTHNHRESADSDSMTKTNTHEALFLTALCKYLLQQGIPPSRITILATYTGQMYLIKKEMNNVSKGVRVSAVDNFQGEENDVILLSLVRSNQDNNVGFLKVDNRICVALSRARQGLFIIGNMNNLIASSSTWRQIQKKLVRLGQLSDSLPLKCQTHGTESAVKEAADFKKFPEGGCTQLCGQPLPCGHPCKSVCHATDLEHKEKRCAAPCDRSCSKGHPCQGKCYAPCKPCIVKQLKTLPCQHELELPCHVDPESILCKEAVSKKWACGHEKTVDCSFPVHRIECQEIIPKSLPCGHYASMECFKDPAKYKCRERVDKLLPGCGHELIDVECCMRIDGYTCNEIVAKKLSCGHIQDAPCHVDLSSLECTVLVEKGFEYCSHKIEVLCHQKHITRQCGSPCDIRIKCGHQCRRKCHPLVDQSHLSYNCEKPCVKNCENGHACTTNHPCHLPCPPCTIATKKLFSCGAHSIEVDCNSSMRGRICEFPCTAILPCNHSCENLCSYPCGPCMVMVPKTILGCGHVQNFPCSEIASQSKCEKFVNAYSQAGCGHFSVVPCRLKERISKDESRKYCRESCGRVFREEEGGCGHLCKGSCSECMQGVLHKKCEEKCGRTLVCGHICAFPCSVVCPPCQMRCTLKCDHSQCAGKCGEPCDDCCEPCTWKCEHKRCTKLCREECNRDPCDQPCKKLIMRCGHPCIGICGEACPPYCRICSPSKLTEFILLGNEEDSDSRFIYLPDCRHIIEVEAMDQYMRTDIVDGAIGAKSCPRCKTLITKSKRYGNILRRRQKDVMKVKQLIFGNQAQTGIKQNSAIARITRSESVAEWSKYFPGLREKVLNHLAVEHTEKSGLFGLLKKVKLVPKMIDQHTWTSIELLITHGTDSIKLLQLSEKDTRQPPNLHADLITKYKELLGKLLDRILPLSKMEIQDFEMEFERLFDLRQLYARRTNVHMAGVMAFDVYKAIEGFIFVQRPYNAERKSKLRKELNYLDTLLPACGLGIPDRERRQVLDAMGMKQGHWYKCPNGHIYMIDQCGGAMEEAACNECGARIGGGSHRLRGDNALATEMDGAVAPAWPTNLLQNV